jgi:hypothetical protein
MQYLSVYRPDVVSGSSKISPGAAWCSRKKGHFSAFKRPPGKAKIQTYQEMSSFRNPAMISFG